MRAFSSCTCSAFARNMGLICGGMLLIVIAVTSPALAQEEEPLRGAQSVVSEVPAGYSLVAESSYLQLYMELETARVAVRDRRSARVWLSTPSASQSEAIPASLRGEFRFGVLRLFYARTGHAGAAGEQRDQSIGFQG